MEPEEPASSPPPAQQRRLICSTCDRPQAVCLCHVIPPAAIATMTRIIILHHPHESQHKLNTTPLLTKFLLHVTTVSGRRLLQTHLPNYNDDQSPRTIYLFPPSSSSPAVPLSNLQSLIPLNSDAPPLTLVVFDATWKHAKEMVRASEGALKSIGAIRICLDTEFDETVGGGSIYDSELLLRKEPFGGCVSTLEAVARCLGAVEPDGMEIERKLIEILREMVRLQAGFLKPVKPRPKLLKKNQQKEKERNESSDF